MLCSTVERTDKLHNKVKNLNECLLNNTEIDVGDRTGGPGIVAKKQSLFYKGTRPSAVSLFSWINSKVLLTFISKLLLIIDYHNDLLRCRSWLSADYFCIVLMISWLGCGCNCCTAASIKLYHVTHLNSSLSWTLIFIRLSYILNKISFDFNSNFLADKTEIRGVREDAAPSPVPWLDECRRYWPGSSATCKL